MNPLILGPKTLFMQLKVTSVLLVSKSQGGVQPALYQPECFYYSTSHTLCSWADDDLGTKETDSICNPIQYHLVKFGPSNYVLIQIPSSNILLNYELAIFKYENGIYMLIQHVTEKLSPLLSPS